MSIITPNFGWILLPKLPDKALYSLRPPDLSVDSKKCFFKTKIFVVGAQKNCLDETLL